MADIKYPDSTPVDEPVRTGTKTQEPGSSIRVEKEPAPKPAPKAVKKAKGGMTASKRADGIATRGKTRGRLL
jgi:hypothetical protein